MCEVRRASGRVWHLLGTECKLVFSPSPARQYRQWEPVFPTRFVQIPNWRGVLGRASCAEGLVRHSPQLPWPRSRQIFYTSPKSGNWKLFWGLFPVAWRAEVWPDLGAMQTTCFWRCPLSPTSVVGTSGCALTFSQLRRGSPGS